MKRIQDVMLVFILTFAHLASAKDAPCVEAFKKANSEFFSTSSKLGREVKKYQYEFGASVTLAMLVVCAWKVRKIPTAPAACAAVLGPLTGIVYAQALFKRLPPLMESHKIYQFYDGQARNRLDKVEDVDAFVKEFGEGTDRKAIFAQLKLAMEEGELCDGKKPHAYEKVVDILKGRIGH